MLPPFNTSLASDRRPLTPGMVAERWRCSERHVRNLIRAGEIKSFRVGEKLLRVSIEAVEDYEQRGSRAVDGEDAKANRASANNAARLARMMRTKR